MADAPQTLEVLLHNAERYAADDPMLGFPLSAYPEDIASILTDLQSGERKLDDSVKASLKAAYSDWEKSGWAIPDEPEPEWSEGLPTLDYIYRSIQDELDHPGEAMHEMDVSPYPSDLADAIVAAFDGYLSDPIKKNIETAYSKWEKSGFEAK